MVEKTLSVHTWACHLSWALTTRLNTLLTQLSFPFSSFPSFLPVHVHDLAWLIFLGKWHEFLSTIYICIYLYLIFHLQVFFPVKRLTTLWSKSCNSWHLYLVPIILLKLLTKVTNDTCPRGLLYGIWHCWTPSCMTLPCFSYLNYWSFQGSLAFSCLCVLSGQSHSLNTYNNSTLTLMTSRSAHLQWCPKPHSPALKPDDTSFLLKVCSFSCPSDS